ncbi:hypothetical protein FB565_008134 [Actinoplanes lutulentus]|uniref:Uncharacterized protein n=1 Tax=Actinoplanes lutulentus TaxID=1287878 RepID=A0A327Z5I4_9ACTN|nr:hypothetical protein [Actinoplanes lutulentus]MBB2948351.1 hypothetical protein [Actinoplanes lutulentus]RAK30383.1 hypothetical protein B0I29_11642 [Actinoplanes lutulentus]
MADEIEQAGVWLAQHGLASERATPLIAARLTVRRRAGIAASVLLALFLIVVALVYTLTLRDEAHPSTSLLYLSAAVIALVAGLALIDRQVRRADRRAAATLVRRVAHPGRLGWRTVLGLPRAVFAVVTFAGALVAAICALPGIEAAILLIGLCGVAAGMGVQLRHLLTHPAVADDEVSLTADAIMRVEDARNLAAPTVVWCLPVVSLLAAVPGWWTAAWLVFIVLGTVALIVINARTPSSGTVARLAMGVTVNP